MANDKSGAICGLIVIIVIVVGLVLFFKACSSGKSGADDGADPDLLRVSKDLVLVKQPKDFAPAAKEISPYFADGKEGVGSSKFLIFPQVEGAGFSLKAFTQNCSISDLSWMMTQVYNQDISPKIVSGEVLNAMDIAVIELAIQVHLAYIHSATAQFFVGAFEDLAVAKKLLGSYYLHCFPEYEFWDKTTTDTINTLCLRWYASERGVAARKIGQCFSECYHGWLFWALGEICKESSPDIRWPNLIKDGRGVLDRWFGDKPSQLVYYNFDVAYDMSILWKEIHTSIYFESVSAVRRINKEISIALSRVHDVDGYPELHALIEKWRPRMKSRVHDYSITYSDLPLVVLSKAAYDLTKVADKTFSTDRPLVRKVAQQYTRGTADGQMHQFAVSATSGSLTSQYHGYLKRLLGKDDYQTFINSIKWRKSDPLKEE